ncbi:hypothetical protein CMT86_19160, partial [Elizabethkingia anophelis]
ESRKQSPLLYSNKIQYAQIPFNKNYTIIAALNPEILVNRQNGEKSKVKYRVVVYNASTGKYVTQKSFIRYCNENIVIKKLDEGKSYTFIAYSISSQSNIPDVLDKESYSQARIENVREDLIFFKRNMTLIKGSNTLNIIGKHQYGRIIINVNAMGKNIENIDNVTLSPTYKSADLFFFRDSSHSLSYNGSLTSKKVIFSRLNQSKLISEPVVLIFPLTGEGQLNIGSLTINGETKNNIKLDNIKIFPGGIYNLNITIKPRRNI